LSKNYAESLLIQIQLGAKGIPR